MARIARVVVPDIPHHITQRGNRRMETFFSESDYREYLYLMAEWCNRCKVQIWSYCLMPNHTHLIAVPESEEGLVRAIGEHIAGIPAILISRKAGRDISGRVDSLLFQWTNNI